MKRSLLTVVALSLLLVFGSLMAQDPVLIDKTGTDFQSYWYVEGHGQQLIVDENGTVHAVYTKTWCTESDTGYQVMYANVTDGTTMEVPSQEPDDPVQPGVIFIGGGQNGTPVYMYYGAGSRMYSYADDMHNQAIARLNGDGTIEGLGVQEDQMYYASAHYANPIEIVVDNVNGIAHIIQTNPGGHEIGYWNFDGTNFGECYNLYGVYADAGVPGKSIPGQYRRRPTKGADIDVTSDGATVMVVGLHPSSQILLHKGDLGGNLWADDFFLGLDDGSVMCVFDTTGCATGDNLVNDQPKPFTYVGIAYDATDKLHMVFDCVYSDIYYDTTNTTAPQWDSWDKNYLNKYIGDNTGVFFDGSEKPKEQLRYWNEDMGLWLTDMNSQTVQVAVCDYPMAGDTFEWFEMGVFDSGPAFWGKYWDGLISNLEFIANADPQEGEPLALVAWEEMDSPATTYVDTNRSFGSIGYNYVAYTHDVKVAWLTAEGWSNPVNLTNSPNMDETGISLHPDVIDNTIHMMWYADAWAGRDRFMPYVDDFESNYVVWAPPSGGHFGVPIRNDEATYANIYYQAIDLATLTSIEPMDNLAPVKFEMAQNYPNPFNPTTSIKYTVPSGNVNLTVYDLLGQKVKTLVNTDVAAGAYEVNWDGTNAAGNLVSSGVYFYKLTSDAGVISKKMLLQR